MRVTASQLRADVYNLLDAVLQTGEPLEIERGGQLLRIVPARAGSWVDRLRVREGVVVGDPEDLAQLDWSSHWDPGAP
ncbi:MAG: type II toxin-antitoxin system Phd/YefM family antitoxin [Pseudomonadota bacterium]|nr:type II toxin-antitoxin system Phd/YefM family antitoxin [Pseudomonadota bacterium]